jgi:two-component system cell cycle sensor histidine kinase/response regulator CckA
MTSKAALARLFAPKRHGLLADLAGRSDLAMQLLFDTAETGLLLADTAGFVLRANPALRAMLDASVDLQEGAPAALIFAPEERTAAWRNVEALLRRPRGEECRFTARLRRADAEPHHLADIACRPIADTDADGPVDGVLLRIADITERARLEAALAEGRGLQTVGRLAGGVAHDFNNLLTTIIGAVELAQGHAPDGHARDPQIAAELDQIRRAAERGAALVRNLLALGRQQQLQARPLDVNAALRDVAGLLRGALGKGVTLELDLEEPGRFVRADPGQLDQVLMNLVMNASNAMPEGGWLTLRSAHATLYRGLAVGRESVPAGRYVVISVRDTGTGIPPELLDRIFEPFFTTRRAQGGSGLGLASAHGIVRQSGGYLTVDSEPGRGSEFRIYLPREHARPPPSPSEPVADRVPPKTTAARSEGRSVLLVDDEDAVRRIAARALALKGWEVLQADSAEAALALLDADPAVAPAALVSDVVMPGMDGPALVQAVRARLPGLPAILVSGYAEQGVLSPDRARDVAFLGKPYAPKQLVAKLEEIVPAPG